MKHLLILLFAVALLFLTTLWLIDRNEPSDRISENPCFYGCPTEIEVSNEGKR
jgi:hypothetical protein